MRLLAEWFAPTISAEAGRVSETWGKAHGRLEHRTIQRRRLLPCGRVDWLRFPGARQGLARDFLTHRICDGSTHTARTYALSNLPPEQTTVTALEALWRGHWHSENQAHHMRDVTCGEDAGQAWVGQTPHTLAALRNGALVRWRSSAWSAGSTWPPPFVISACPPRAPLPCSVTRHLPPYDFDTALHSRARPCAATVAMLCCARTDRAGAA